jgi:hypothetical protein
MGVRFRTREMSAFGGKADMAIAVRNVCFWTKADKAGFWPAMVCPPLTQSGHCQATIAAYLLGLWCQLLPGGRYKLAVLEALSATALNSAAVQALEVVTSEIMPAAAVANNAAMRDSAS